MRETQRRQVPWEHSALTGRFYFIPSAPAIAVTPPAAVEPPPPPVAALTPPNTVTRTPSIITGAGAMFPYPIYALWSEAYKKETGIGLNYQSVGSRAGIRQILARTVAFAASDLPLQSADLERDGLLQFPAVMGGPIPIVNIEGVKAGDIALDGAILAKIFLGEIKSWNDPAIQRLNPYVRLPAQPIVAVHRSDASATTYVLTHYLSKVSTDWRTKVGADITVEWRGGIGAKGNDGVANAVAQTKGAIGYAEYAFAMPGKRVFGVADRTLGLGHRVGDPVIAFGADTAAPFDRDVGADLGPPVRADLAEIMGEHVGGRGRIGAVHRHDRLRGQPHIGIQPL